MGFTVNQGALRGNPAQGTYLNRRNLNVLKEVGALNDDQVAVMERADQIGLGNKNNQIEVKELNSLFTDAFDTLFPEEKQALETVWPKFQLQNANFETPQLRALPFEDIPAQLGQVDPDMPFAIADLPQDTQRIARRIQLNINQTATRPPSSTATSSTRSSRATSRSTPRAR
jgi:hypothetical protein